MTNYMPHSKKPKKKLDTWTIKYVYKGQRDVWTPDYDPQNPTVEDCTDVVIENQRTGETVTVKDYFRMMEFWKEIQGFSFEWKGGKRIQKRTIAKALKENGYEISRSS
jgi:hypothetical protein